MRNCVVMLLLAAFPAAGWAQADAKDDAKNKEGAKNSKTEGPLSPTEATEETLKLRSDLNALSEIVTKFGTELLTLKSEQSQMKLDLDELKRQYSDNLAKQQEILEQISSEDVGGARIPRLSANMKASAAFKQEMTDAVHEALRSRTTGTLVLNNRTQQTRQVAINRTTYYLDPGESRTVEVPVGNVTTQLAGGSTRNWTLGAPDYRLSLDVVPVTEPTTVQRPVEAVPAPISVPAPTVSVPAISPPVYYYYDPFAVYWW